MAGTFRRRRRPRRDGRHVRFALAEFLLRFGVPWSVDHAGGVERARGQRGRPEPDRRGELAGCDPRRQVRHRNFHDEVDDDLDDQRDQTPDQAIDDVGGMCDGADHRQDKADKAEAERDRGGRIIVADQLEFVVRGDAGVDEQIGRDGDQRGAEIDQERRAARRAIAGSFKARPQAKAFVRKVARSVCRCTRRAGSIPRQKPRRARLANRTRRGLAFRECSRCASCLLPDGDQRHLVNQAVGQCAQVHSPQTKTPPFSAGFSREERNLSARGQTVKLRRECALRPRAARAARSRGPTRSR